MKNNFSTYYSNEGSLIYGGFFSSGHKMAGGGVNEINEKTNNMKELIIEALNDAFVVLEKRVPQTKKELKEVSISDVRPLYIVQFMKDNNIPDDASFGGVDNGYDGYSDICLYWDIDVPTTDKDKLKFKRKAFSSIAHKYLYDLLIKNGYKRVGFNSGLLKQFDDTTVFDMYANKDFDRLVKYYSLSFVKE